MGCCELRDVPTTATQASERSVPATRATILNELKAGRAPGRGTKRACRAVRRLSIVRSAVTLTVSSVNVTHVSAACAARGLSRDSSANPLARADSERTRGGLNI